MELQQKEEKDANDIGKLLRKGSKKKKCLLTAEKAICRQTIPECSCARKDTVNIDIFLTPRNGGRKIMQPIRIES